MSHFAEIDGDGIVQRVIVIEQDVLDSGNWGDPNNWIQTSYNTRGGIHYAPNSNDPDDGVALRKNYAGKGYTYDQTRDAFIPPQPYPSWNLNEDTCQWSAPVAYPDDGKRYNWDEDNTQWVEVEIE
jgi:asparagine N-glycosylation enzyme membrane subunit Stt3